MFCPYCGIKISDRLDYCTECNASLDSLHRPTNFKCDQCDSVVPKDSNYCPKCGKKFEEKSKRESRIVNRQLPKTFQCDNCNSIVPEDSNYCPKCGKKYNKVIVNESIKYYYYLDGDKSKGPFKIEELRNKNLENDTLIWYGGLKNWKPLKEIKELEEILELSPPPIQGIETNRKEKDSKNYEIVNDSKIHEDVKKTINIKKRRMFSRTFYFEGRIRRLEYGISFIIFAILLVFLNELTMYKELAFLAMAYLPLYYFIFAQGAKRCHDMGRSGWWQLIPFYGIWMIFAEGEKGVSNKYGVNPKL